MNEHQRKFGFLAFFMSGICSISAGVIVSILQEKYGFSFGVIGTLLSCMSIGNVIATFLCGILPAKIGAKNTVMILSAGNVLGYVLMSVTGIVGVLIAAFLMIGLAKGCALNNCTILVGTNSEDKTRSLSLMHSSYAFGALLCPILIALLAAISDNMAIVGLALFGVVAWIVFYFAGLGNERKAKDGTGRTVDYSFMKDATFWIITGLIFCQNAAETSVTGWLVTYYKDSAILSGTLANYTVTVMWGATLISRLLVVFVFPIKNTYKALGIYGFMCTILYGVLVMMHTPFTAIVALFCFAFSMAPVNPTAVAGVGKLMSNESMGILFPISSTGAIIMPWIIGVVADHFGLHIGMLTNIVPCAGIMILSLVMVFRLKKTEKAGA